MRQHLAERRAAARAEADEQRALEPAAMLVAAFEVDVRRPGQLRPHRQHRLVARTRIEPDVEDVHLALEVVPPQVGQVRPGGHELLDRPLVPGVGAVASRRPPRRCSTISGRQHRFAAARAVERRNRHAPRALARDAPVRPVRDHVVDAVVPPRRESTSPGDRRLIDGRFAQRLATRRRRRGTARPSR